VVDNASTDGSVAMLREHFPYVRRVELPRNLGVAGYNFGAREARAEFLLILDDDSWPDRGALRNALDFLSANRDTGGVALLPVHPQSGKSEWRFAKGARSRWPVMGCGNLVRTDAWRAVGGYEELFFLYRNDTDLALKLLASGRDVYFNPDWRVWHDSPGVAFKGEYWLRYATRNWVWMCRRHGRGVWGKLGEWAGVAWALRLAGWDMSRLRLVLAGVGDARRGHVPSMPATVNPDGSALRELLRLHFSSRFGGK
jgi:GT2 family glycosyltransferase